MKTVNPFLKISSLIIVCAITFNFWGCKRDTSIKDPEDSKSDAVVDYKPKVDGFFEGDKTPNFPNDIEPEVNWKTSFKDNQTNTISVDAIKQIPDFSMQDFMEAYKSVLSEFPNINKTSDEFAKKIMDKIVFNAKNKIVHEENLRVAHKDVIDIFNSFIKLTFAEKLLVLSNPNNAEKTQLAAAKAVEATRVLFGGNGYKTRSDAFRHSYWNWLMSKSCSVDWAMAFGNAHESATPNDDDKRMDLNNNMIGRRVFSNNPSVTEAEAQKLLLDYKLLWLNEEQKNVVVGIDYLVYLSPGQSLTVFDDGPSYDDIYDITWNGTLLGTTPEGGSKAFEFSEIASDTYNLNIKCKLDGTKGGCGFQILLNGALTLSSGRSNTPQIIIQEAGTHADKLTFPVMSVRKTD